MFLDSILSESDADKLLGGDLEGPFSDTSSDSGCNVVDQNIMSPLAVSTDDNNSCSPTPQNIIKIISPKGKYNKVLALASFL